MENSAESKLDIRVICKEGVAYVFASGKLNKSSSEELKRLLEGIEEKDVVLDFEGLEYISSAGLRVLVSAMQRLDACQGSLVIKNPSPMVTEVFEITGLSGMLVIR